MPFSIKTSETIRTRLQLADLCNSRNIVCAVEVGTDQGVYAGQFLERWKGHKLYCIDDYAPYPAMGIDRMPDLMLATAHLSQFVGRVRLLKMASFDAAHYMTKEGIVPQFVYIDAAHDFLSVQDDIARWWKVLGSGGIIAGHDYDEEHSGVIAAVKGFAEANDLAVTLTADADSPPSWFIEKR